MQKKRHSLLEVCISTAIGFVVSFFANIVVMPVVFNIHPTMAQNTIATIFFTVVSIIRGYWVRRLFNWLHWKEIL